MNQSLFDIYSIPETEPKAEVVKVKRLNRIVIGDVGSGKTVVAFLTALSYLYGLPVTGQVCLLAPTEVLAYQHYTSLEKLIATFVAKGLDFQWLNRVFLTAKNVYLNGQKLTKKKLVAALTQTNRKTFWIGTHALLHNEQIVPDLVMVDEQHRFGVEQRSKLSRKNTLTSPHFISFTATPIPRTLALTFYDTLKPIFLERLANRSPIVTSLFTFAELETKVVEKIRSHLAKGRKIYVVCAKVQADESATDEEIWSVYQTSKLLERFFPNQIMLVHGKMADKKDILTEFKHSSTKGILVATTVIEVGVDVPQASLVVILNAERFGLAALHQIRGRVGRNDFSDNECCLVTYTKYKRSRRLHYVCQTQDGFALAEKDLELRGAGELLGKIQSGFGDEIDKIIGLNPALYRRLSQEVDKIDFTNLDTLPRLKKYLQTKAGQVWKE